MTATIEAPFRASGSARDVRAAEPDGELRYQPVLELQHGRTAGYQLLPLRRSSTLPADELSSAAAVLAALSIAATLPAGVFLSLPIPVACATGGAVRAALASAPTLADVVLDIVGTDEASYPELEHVVDEYRSAGALISVGGDGTAQPELTSIGRLKPAIIRLGREWVRDIEQVEAKRSTIAVIGEVAAQLHARILCEGVATEAELRTLAELGVTLAQGPFVGNARRLWSGVHARARSASRTARGTAT